MLELRNKYIFALVKTGYGTKEGGVTQRHLDFYDRRSKDVGLVVPEPLALSPEFRELPTQMILWDKTLDGMRSLVETVHKNGAKIAAHLNHPGRMANPKIPGNIFLSSTDRACENGGATPRKMTKTDIELSVDLFVSAARKAESVGFDAIELQFGHGYLVAQFLSPAVNDRTDEYGGSFENRIRFALEVFDAVKAAVSVPIVVRLSADEMIPDGFSLDEARTLVGLLEKRGVSAIHVIAGSLCHNPPWFFQHMFLPKGKTWQLAAELKKSLSVPVIAVGRVESKEDVEQIFGMGIDYVAAGRALVADPRFFAKIDGRNNEPLRPCMGCAEGCLGGVKSGKGLGCMVNPEAGHSELNIEGQAESAKHIAVIGGGLAGMEAAVTLKKRGHTVTLFEKEQLGGQFNLAWQTPHKQPLKALVPFYQEEIACNDISVVQKEATPQDVEGHFDAVVVATGSRPAVLDIEGLTHSVWAEILLPEHLPENKRVLIIGGGMIGVDIASSLVARNNKVIMVKRTENFGEDMEAISKVLTLKELKEKGVRMVPHTHVKRVDGNRVYAEVDGKEEVFEGIDLIVVSAGMRPEQSFAAQMKEGGTPLFVIGDAEQVGDATAAIVAGRKIGLEL